MKYLRKFETETEYNAFPKSPTKSYVSLISDGNVIKYDKPIAPGIYVQHIDGKLYTKDEWTNGGYAASSANGVALVSEQCAFVVAKDKISDKLAWSSNTKGSIAGILTTSDKPSARGDFAGEANTALMLATDTSGAAYRCANFTFPNGKKGYLPSLGEWYLVKQNSSQIISLMSLIGGVAINYAEHWTSTQYEDGRAWTLDFSDGYTQGKEKTVLVYTRPFCSL